MPVNTTMANNAATANANAQMLQTKLLEMYNDAGLLLGNIASLQTSINASSSRYDAPDAAEIGQAISALREQLIHIHKRIVALQTSATIPS